MASTDLRSRTEKYREVANKLAEARVEFATRFLLNKMRNNSTDRQAEQMAIVDTNDELTKLYAELAIAKRELDAVETTG